MKKCGIYCAPICDYCIYAYHEYFEWQTIKGDYRFEPGSTIGCIIHYDEKHQKIARSYGGCEDFYCRRQFKKDIKEADVCQ